MKKWLKFLIVAVVVGIIAVIAVLWYINKPNKDIEKAKAEYTLNVNELYKQYSDNKVTADSLYNGKVIEINGNVSTIETPSDTLVVAVFTQQQDTTQPKTDDLFSDLNAGGGVRCTMLKNHCEVTKNTAPNSVIRIKGLCKGMSGADLIFEKCSIVK
ncbi:MAG: OB-fold protein [Bacteroidales bacterium]